MIHYSMLPASTIPAGSLFHAVVVWSGRRMSCTNTWYWHSAARNYGYGGVFWPLEPVVDKGLWGWQPDSEQSCTSSLLWTVISFPVVSPISGLSACLSYYQCCNISLLQTSLIVSRRFPPSGFVYGYRDPTLYRYSSPGLVWPWFCMPSHWYSGKPHTTFNIQFYAMKMDVMFSTR